MRQDGAPLARGDACTFVLETGARLARVDAYRAAEVLAISWFFLK